MKAIYYTVLVLQFSLILNAQLTEYYTKDFYSLEKIENQFHDEVYITNQNFIQNRFFFHQDNHIVKNNLWFKKIICNLSLNKSFALSELKKYLQYNPKFEDESHLLKCLVDYYLLNKVDHYNNIQYLEQFSWNKKNKHAISEYNYKLGFMYFIYNDYKKALPLLKNANTFEKYKLSTSYMIGHIYYEMKDFSQVITYFYPLLENPKYSIKVSPYLLQIYYHNKKYDQAIKQGKNLLLSEEYPPHLRREIYKIISESYFQQKQFKKAIPYLEKYINENKTIQNVDLYQLGYMHYIDENYQKAIENFNKIIDERSEIAQNAYYQLGNSYLKINQKQEALIAFKNASEFDFNKKISENAYYNYAKLSYETENSFESRVEIIKNFIKQYPENSNRTQMEWLLVKLYLKSKTYKDALNFLDDKKDKKNKLQFLHQEIAFLYAMQLFDEGKYHESIPVFQYSIEKKKSSKLQAKALFWLSESYFRLENYQEALINLKNLEKNLEFSTESYSEESQLNYLFGYSYLKMNDFENAVKYFEKFIIKHPKHELKTDAELRLADSYIGLNDYKKAILIYDNHTEDVEFNSESLLYQKSMIYGLQGNNVKKIKNLEKYITYYPESKNIESIYLELAYAYSEQKKYLPSNEYFKKIIDLNQTENMCVLSLFGQANNYVRSGQNDKAIEVYKNIIQRYKKIDYIKRAVEEAQPVFIQSNKIFQFEQWVKNLGYTLSIENKELLHITVAQKSFYDKKYEETIKKLFDFKNQFPKSNRLYEVNYMIGESFYQMKKLENAIKFFIKVCNKINDKQEDALFRSSQIYLQKNQFNEAIISLESLDQITKNPNYKSFLEIELMRIYFYKKLWNQAEIMVNRVMNNSKNSLFYFEEANLILAGILVNKKDNYAKILLKKLEKSRNKKIKAELLYYKAYFLFEDKQFKESNKIILDIASKYASEHYVAAKSLLLMSKNYYYLGDKYQANHVLNNVLENYRNYFDVIDDAKNFKLDLQ